MTVSSVTEHQPWCVEHVVDGPEHELDELDFCSNKVRFPGGYAELHNADGPVVVDLFVEGESAPMTPSQAATFVLDLARALMVDAESKS